MILWKVLLLLAVFVPDFLVVDVTPPDFLVVNDVVEVDQLPDARLDRPTQVKPQPAATIKPTATKPNLWPPLLIDPVEPQQPAKPTVQVAPQPVQSRPVYTAPSNSASRFSRFRVFRRR